MSIVDDDKSSRAVKFALDALHRVPTSLLALLLLCLLSFNALSIFSVRVTLPQEQPRRPSSSSAAVLMYAVAADQDDQPPFPKTPLLLLHHQKEPDIQPLSLPGRNLSSYRPPRRRRRRAKITEIVMLED